MIHNRKQIRAIITIDIVLILVGLLVVAEEGLGISRELLCLSLSSIYMYKINDYHETKSYQSLA